MEKSDTDSLEEWDVVTVSQVLASSDTVVASAKNGSESPAKEESPTLTPPPVPTEPQNVSDTQPENGTQADNQEEDEPRSESESQGEEDEESKASSPEPESQVLAVTADKPKSENLAGEELEAEAEISESVEEEKSKTSDRECSPEAVQQEADKNVGGDIAEKESSPANIECGSCAVDMLEQVVRIIEVESAAIDSSSSDIDIIDEMMEESTISTSMMSSPLSLSISSSVADTSSLASAPSQFVEVKHYKPEVREEPKRENVGKREEKKSQKRSKRSPSPRKRDSRQGSGTTHRTFYDWLVLVLQFFQNMSPYDWCVIGTVAVSLYLTVIFRQTNIFAFVQKDDAMSQMKDMIEELKHDNKILKEQMMSEFKNEKAFSSFEHQIKELRKENSKLNHMLYDVAKVLDKQKDFQEKKEAEYLAPFKKEINKLKEYINVLKIDNEELQKEMVRMRYSGSHPREKEAPAKEDIQLDIESLKKWNELITLLSKELGLLAEADVLKGQRSDKKPFWKDLLNNFKSSYNSFRKANLSEVFSEYKEAKKKVVTDIYLLVKDFFTAEESPSAGGDNAQWKSVGDFMEDLKEKWTNIKDRLYASDLRSFFQKSSQKSPTEEHRSTAERVNTRTSYDRQDSHPKPSAAGTKEEDTRWMFERAADRENQRGSSEEDEANWFLKRGRHNSEDKGHRHL